MPNPAALNPDLFLNRLALDEMTNPRSLDPYYILESIFIFAGPDEFQDLFGNFCTAALAEEFAWKKESPGNLLSFSEKLEQLIEACFLIYNAGKKKKQLTLKKKAESLKKVKLPTRLTEKEWRKPIIVLDDFFTYNSLPQWKHTLHSWVEAGFSNFSVAENTDPAGLLVFFQHMEKLIDAAHLITIRSRR